MKKSIVLSAFIFASIISYGQAGIKIYTNLDEAKFKIVFNGEEENVMPIKEVSFDSLDYKKSYKVVISFSADTIADIEEEFRLLKDQVREFEIMKKSSILRKTSKVGRKIGKALKIGSHDKEAILYDVFYLEERTKSEYHNN
ncbi:MAG: hypothetical protein U0W24_23730 [Bacteroidales bacterium]